MGKNQIKKNTFLTITDSKALYGIAIILMVMHHCFYPTRLGNDYFPFISYEFEKNYLHWENFVFLFSLLFPDMLLL